MAVLASKVSIISQAYYLLGERPVNTLQTNNDRDVGAAQRYDFLVPTLLTITRWKHAGKTIELTQLTDEPPTEEWNYTFQLPNKAEMLLAYKVYPYNFKYQIMGDKLYTDHDKVTLFYIYNPSEDQFPTYFVNYLIYTMAAELSMPITQKAEIESLWRKRALQAKIVATSLDAQQTPSESIRYDGLTFAHGGGDRFRNIC